jgi:hypothetical protein
MGVERTGFEILMTADASGIVKGSKEGADALDNVAGKTKELNEKLAEGKERLKEHGAGMEEGAKHAHLFGQHTHEAHAAVKSLGEILPGVGGLARDLFSLQTLGIGALGMVAGFAIEKWQELGKAQDAAIASAAKGLGHLRELQEQAKIDAAAARGELEAELNRASEATTTLETLAQRRIAIYEAQIAAAKRLAEAQDELEKQAIRDSEQAGTLSHEQAGERLAALGISASRRNASLSASGEDFRIRSMEAEAESAKMLTPQATAEYEAARDKAKSLQDESKNTADVLKDLKEGFAGLNRQIEEASIEYEQMRRPDRLYAVEHPFGHTAAQEAEVKQKRDDAIAERERTEKLIRQSEEKQQHLAEQIPQAQSAAGAAHARLQDYEHLAQNLPGQIETARSLQGIHGGAESAAQAIQDMGAAKSRADAALANARGVAPGTPGIGNVMSRLVDSHAEVVVALEEANAAHVADHQELETKLREVDRQLAQFRVRLDVNRNQ